MIVKCVKCGRERSEKYMQEAVFRNPYWEARDEGVGIYKCSTSESCKQERKRLRRENSNGNLSQNPNAVQA